MNPHQLLQSSTANLTASLTVLGQVIVGRLQRRVADRERGDVPGWVLITLMTAGLVTILWSLAATQLTALFTKAMTSVTGP
jgi:hypothetical protein